MLTFPSASARRNAEPVRRNLAAAARTARAIVSTWAIVITLAGCSGNRSESAYLTQEPPAPAKLVPVVASPPPASIVVAQSRDTLEKLRNQLNGLAERILSGVDLSDPNDVDVPSQTLLVESAKAAQQEATLNREAAEIALKAYEEAVFPQEKKTSDAEIPLAQAELEHAAKAVEPAKERYAEIKQRSNTSAPDLVLLWQSQAGVTSAELELKKATFALEQAKSKRRVLLEYEHGKRLKDLKSAIEKARSAELQRRARAQLEESKLKHMQEPASSMRPLTSSQKEILAQLDRAIPLERQLTDRLASIQDDKPAGDFAINDIKELTRQLQGVANQALDVESRAALVTLNSGLRSGFLRSGTKLEASRGPRSYEPAKLNATHPPSTAAELPFSEFLERTHERIRVLEAELITLGVNALRPVYTDSERRDYLVNQLITAKSAEAGYENAKLTREVAEIGLTEYEEGIFKQDEANVEGEVVLADANASRAEDAIDMAEAQLAEIKKVSSGSAQDLALEHKLTDFLADARIRLPRAELAHEQALSARDVLRRFTKPTRVKEIRAGIEKARSEELAKKAAWERENSKVERLKKPIAPQPRTVYRQRTLELLQQAVAGIETLRPRLSAAEKDAQGTEPVRREISKMLDQLEALFDQAAVEHAKGMWAEQAPKVHEAAARYLGAKTQ